MKYALRITHAQHRALQAHLFPGDGKEAVALLLCGRRAGSSRHVLLVRQIHPVPHERCKRRSADCVTWPTDVVDRVLPEAFAHDYAVVKVHSHVVDKHSFSPTDDTSDEVFFSSVSSLLDDELPHASLVMMPSGEIFGRVIMNGKIAEPISSVMVVGDDLVIWENLPAYGYGEFALRSEQAFGKGTIRILRGLSVAVVGCSGTGSFVTEHLARLGVGKLILVDPDRVEEKNLNRILNSGKKDAYLASFKVHTLAQAIARMGLDQQVLPMPVNLATAEAILAVANCDVVFGCMDGTEGRHILNRLASFYSLPYFDVGVRLDADGKGGISGISGAVHYLQPGLSSLFSRGVYSMNQVEAEGMRRTSPEIYRQQRGEGYLRGIVEDRPAVITVNGIFASLAVQELLARLHPYRNQSNRRYSYVGGNLAEMQIYAESEGESCLLLSPHVGRGDTKPILNLPGLS
ncbi:MAG: ThiF family adenylyltransferase [Acidobacteriia bacterium]|nr:ThiF family adenylyltransferase [Terriglobia bacterium]